MLPERRAKVHFLSSWPWENAEWRPSSILDLSHITFLSVDALAYTLAIAMAIGIHYSSNWNFTKSYLAGTQIPQSRVIQVSLKALAFSVRPNLEFAILSKLMEVTSLARNPLSISMSNPVNLRDEHRGTGE